jgi:hypothetical protein
MPARAGEVRGDVFILVRGELHVLDSDQKTMLFKIPEGTVFGEGTVLKHLEVRWDASCLQLSGAKPPELTSIQCTATLKPTQGLIRAKRTDSVLCATPCTMLRIAQVRVLVCQPQNRQMCTISPLLRRCLLNVTGRHE